MKKIFYLIFLFTFFILCINDINAEEIDCSKSEFACVKCKYNLPFNNSYVEFTSYSDGKKVFVNKKQSIGTANVTANFDYSATNFELKDDNKLACPSKLFYTSSQDGTSYYKQVYNFSFSTETNLSNVGLVDEYNNNKDVYKNQTNIKSCKYRGNAMYNYNIDVYTDGTEVWYDDSNSNYKISGTDGLKIEKFVDEDGNFYDNCPVLNFRCTNIGQLVCSITDQVDGTEDSGQANETGDDLQQFYQFIEGDQFLYLLGSLKAPLTFLSQEKLGSLAALDIPLTIDGNENATLNNDVEVNNGLCSGDICSSNSYYLAEQGIRNIRQYCNVLYQKYPEYKSERENLDKRMKECINFNKFYNQLVKDGVIDDLTKGCDIISAELKAKIDFVLNIIKIAGPLLALGFGTLDFIKVLANGDADKEMKSAFKNFSIRLGAAALLFIVPLILAFLLDMFLSNQDGYNPDNPFCIEIDWDE